MDDYIDNYMVHGFIMGLLINNHITIKNELLLRRVLNLPENSVLPPKLPRPNFSKLKEILWYPQHKELPVNNIRRCCDYYTHFSCFKQFREKICINPISSGFNITMIFMTFTTLSGHSILLTDSDKIFINKKKKNKRRLENVAKELSYFEYDHANQNYIYPYKNDNIYVYLHQLDNRTVDILVNIKNVVVNILVIQKKYKYGYPRRGGDIGRYLKKYCRVDNLEKIRMNPEELEKELVEYCYHPKRFELFKWQLDLE
jgi:hypothetical protein